MAGLFLSSILEIEDGRGEVEGDVAAGIRQRLENGPKVGARKRKAEYLKCCCVFSQVSSRNRPCRRSSSRSRKALRCDDERW
jgi:hypothetical protein